MTDDKITAETIAKVGAELGVKPGGPKSKYPVDFEVEEIVVDSTTHYRLHLLHDGWRSVTQNHSAGPELDALIAEAEKHGFRVFRTKAGGKARR